MTERLSNFSKIQESGSPIGTDSQPAFFRWSIINHKQVNF